MYTRYALEYVWRSYKPSYAIMFLILVGMAGARYSYGTAVLVIFGYIVFDFLDCVLKRRDIEKLIEYETGAGWQQDNKDSEHEYQGNLSRIKLPRKDQISRD